MPYIIIAGIAVIIIAMYFFMTQSKKLPEYGKWLIENTYAHRGLHNKQNPENTLGAFQNAVQNRYAIEMDVQLSKDKKVIVFHDNNLERLTGINGKIKDFTAEELSSFKINHTDFGIPTLCEVLELVNGEVPLLIETKNEGLAGELEPLLYDLLKNYTGKFAVQSFSPFSMNWFKRNTPEIVRGQLASDFKTIDKTKPEIFYFSLKHLIVNFISKPDFISYDKSGIKNAVIHRLKKFGTGILCWTIENSEEQKAVSPYTDTIIFENFDPKTKS